MLFRKSKYDPTLEEAIEFVKTQKAQNKKHMKIIDAMDISIDELKKWDNIYDYVLEKLKSMRK